MKRGIAMVVVFASASACASKQPTPVVVGSSSSSAVAAVAAPAVGDTLEDDLGLSSSKAELVVGIDFQQARSSKLWKRFVESKLAMAAELQKLVTACGFDPIASMRRMTVAIADLDAASPTGTVVVRGFDKTKTLACFETLKQATANSGNAMTRDGDLIVITDKQGRRSTSMFVAADTMLVALGGDRATLAEYARGGSLLRTSPAFRAMLATIGTTHTLWAIMRGDSKVLAPIGFRMKAIFGSLDVTDRLSLVGRVRMTSADEATEVAATAKSQAEMLTPFVDRLDVATDGADITIDASLSADKLALIESVLPGMSSTGP